jgi:hypothetical protein
MNLIYICVFHEESYIQLFKLLIDSLTEKGKIQSDTHILILTTPSFQTKIHEELTDYQLIVYYYILDLHTLFEAGCARLHIFNYEYLHLYDKILYLDTDILIQSDINVLFQLPLSDKVYALEEGCIGNEYWGNQFFDFTQYDRNISAFTSGILLFNNTESIRSLFDTIQSHIVEYIDVQQNPIPTCLEQPFIVYNAITQQKYDNQLLTTYAENNPTDINPTKIIYHFPEDGVFSNKIEKMNFFWEKIKLK